MTATVEQLQSEWRKLIDLAQRGEETVLTQNGRAVARLTALVQTASPLDPREWLAELAQLREMTATGGKSPTTEEILEDLRSERG